MEGLRWNRKRGVRPWKDKVKKTGRRLVVTPVRGNGTRRPGKTAEQTPRRGERRRMWQMVISAVLLMLVVTVKLAAPGVMNRYRRQMLHLLGEDTDIVSTFASAGRAVSPDGNIKNTINDAYTAVFGAEEIPAEKAQPDEKEEIAHTTPEGEVIYTAATTPQQVCLTQQVLGFPYAAPLDGEITSGFGYRTHPILGEEKFHYGMDIAAESGTVIRAFAAGTVSVVAESSDYGKYIIISHPGGFTSLYAHCSLITASSGQQVALGDPIAEVGDTGMTTGPHLHFELMHDSDYLEPMYYVAG